MSLLDIIRGIPERMGRGMERNIGGLLGIDPEDMTEEERRQARRLSRMAVFDAMARGTSPTAGLRQAAELLGTQRASRQERQEAGRAAQDIQQTSAAIAGRLGARGADVGAQTQLEEVRPMSGMNLEALIASPAGAEALKANPQLAELIKQRTGQQVVGGLMFDRATGQYIQPPKEQQPRTPIREIRRGNVVDVYFSDGTTETRPIGVAPTAGGQSGSGVVTLPDIGPVKLTAGDLQRDKDFAKSWTEFSARGGFADAAKQLGQLQEVLARLQSGEDLTGPFTGFLMNNIPSLAAAYQQGAVSAKEAVEEVVQRNLRLILGAQFTEKEGERLIARAYNPSLKEEENARRLQRLIQQMLSAASATQQAGQYFDQFGTLKGYNAKLPSFADFDVTGKSEQVMAEDVPAGIDPRDWQYMTPEQRKLWQK
jgi:hypothetical protein